MTELWILVISLVLIVLCGAFVAAEFALLAVNRSAVERMAASGDSGARGILAALRTLSTQLSGIQLGITIASLTIGYLAEPAISALVDPLLLHLGVPESAAYGVSAVAGIALATAATMVYGELVPKYIALVSPMATARALQRPMRFFTRTMMPLIWLLNGAANYVLKLRGVKPQEELSAARSADELLALVRRSAEKGTLTHATAVMLERSLNFRELTALDIMTPRIRLTAVEAGTHITKLIKLSEDTGLSRFPVYEGNTDNIVGIARIKHAIKIPQERWGTTAVRDIMTAATFVPSTIELGHLLETLKQDNRHIAIVDDEFGGVDGVVTIEDLLEELVGEVYDEHDHSNRSHIKKLSRGKWDISGLLRPDEISAALGVSLPEEGEVETIAGVFMHEIEKMPRVGDIVRMRGIDRAGRDVNVRLTVMKMDKRRIDRIEMSVRKVRVAAQENE